MTQADQDVHDSKRTEEAPSPANLQRGLRQRHLTMIGIGA